MCCLLFLLNKIMKHTLTIIAVAAIVCSCETSKPEVTYTSIEATLAEPIKFDSDVEYARQTYRFPQISSMQNKVAEDSLNRLFKLANITQLQQDNNYINVHLLADNTTPEYGRMYSHESITVYYVDNDLVSFGGMTEYAGGAHPSFTLLPGKTVAVKTLAPIELTALFTGDYKNFFKQKIAASEQLKEYTSDGMITLNEFGNACNDVLDALLLQMDSTTTTVNMVVTDSALSILQVDFRDFGCPEVMRAVIEIRIPYSELTPYINPKGYLSRFKK